MTHPPSDDAGRGRRFRSRHILAGTAAVVTLAACEFPTDPPVVEQRWVIPAEETRFGVAQLLPGDVSLADDSSAFLVDFDSVTFSVTLGSLCELCLVADDQTVPKPPFFGTFSSTVSFPPEVESVDVIDGEVEFALENGFGFDPIRPGDGVFGSMELSISDDADAEDVGSLLIDGEDRGFPAGTTLVDAVVVQPALVEGPIRVSVTLDSPLGDPVTIDVNDTIRVTAEPRNIRVGGVEIDVASRSVTLDPVSLDVAEIDSTFTNRIVSGDFVLDVVNPFGVSADFDIEIAGPTITTIQKSAPIGPEAESRAVIGFTGEELRSFLGQPDVVLSGGAVIDAGAGPVVVNPGEELVLTASLDLTLQVGG